MKLTAIPFKAIKSGTKTIESRLYDEKRRFIVMGDHIEFTQNDNSANKILTRVKALYPHESFDKLFSAFPPELFGGTSKEELLGNIKTFYSKEDERKYGVIGIEIKLIK